MTVLANRRPGARALRALLCAALVLAVLTALGCAGVRHRHHHRQHGYAGDTGTVQIISAEIGGKNVFIPSTIAVRSGEGVTLSIFNTTEKPHGFAIPALGVAEVIPVGEEYTIDLPALEGHQLLQITCHLHTTHRTATLLVLPARKER